MKYETIKRAPNRVLRRTLFALGLTATGVVANTLASGAEEPVSCDPVVFECPVTTDETGNTVVVTQPPKGTNPSTSVAESTTTEGDTVPATDETVPVTDESTSSSSSSSSSTSVAPATTVFTTNPSTTTIVVEVPTTSSTVPATLPATSTPATLAPTI